MNSKNTYGELLDQAKKKLRQENIVEAETDAWILFEECFGLSRASYFMRQTEYPPAEKEEQYAQWLKLRLQHIPVQHLTGYQEFMGYRFFVNDQVLVPRQDTELLVEKALNQQVQTVLDLCTGSGCIGISLKLQRPELSVTASDISPAALKVAEKNAKRLKADLLLVQSDLYENLAGRFDMIVSNPPYIELEELAALAPEVREHEPHLALCGGRDGLDYYRRIIEKAGEHLEKNGILLMEIGCGQAQAVCKLCQNAGYAKTEVFQDYAGLDRVVYAKM